MKGIVYVVHPNFDLSDDKLQFLKEVNPEIHLSIYHNLRAITATDPLLKEGFYDEHQDWFLYCEDDPTEKVRDKKYQNYLADISNEEYRDFWITRTREALEDKPEVIDTIFIDVASARLQLRQFYCKPEKYTDEWWEENIGIFLREIKDAFPDKTIVANSLKPAYSDSKRSLSGNFVGLQYGDYVDGFCAETWTHVWGKYRGETFWRGLLDSYMQKLKQGKWIGVAQHPEKFEDKIDQRRMFGFASYLLIKTKDFGFTELWGIPGEFILKDQIFYIPLRGPKEELKDKVDDYLHNGVYLREYENGLVLVNPSETQTKTYTLRKEMNLVILNEETIKYEATRAVTLPPVSGAILISK
ncbi:MAG: putative glycoside hydrolase family 15 protein [Methanophagales archaeon]|nr:putative glycoside hydrolase family 15 protein [Methanophagales archaeon]